MPIGDLILTNCTGTINIREAEQEDDRVLNNPHAQYSDLTLHGNQNLTISCNNELKNSCYAVGIKADIFCNSLKAIIFAFSNSFYAWRTKEIEF